ncbi:hypothetical protein FHK02_5748 [Spirosoma sp. LMG 31448]|uniref:Uncharacterized protein n=1 Tax=Spirosoma utsteinense TaxID=2585773 RepID=A0ABR6WFX7_9BACT|nr:hypothetical protein [Spirosoma utsteinense]MBC3795088.1 hypothetical protein [Spirosoma utsteinense]
MGLVGATTCFADETDTYSSTSARDFHTIPFLIPVVQRESMTTETDHPIDGYCKERGKGNQNLRRRIIVTRNHDGRLQP